MQATVTLALRPLPVTQLAQTEAWLEGFHAGDRAVMEQCYRDHFGAVAQAIGGYLHGADKETVIHEVFLALISEVRVRKNFQGGSLSAWLRTLAKHRAIDFLRRRRREAGLDELGERTPSDNTIQARIEAADARRVVDAFVANVLPEKWVSVFCARFVEDLSQRDAARKLGISRTTLAYREQRAWQLFRRFVLHGKGRQEAHG